MKLKLEIRDMRPILVTEDGTVVENIEVLNYGPKMENIPEGPIMRLVAEVKILEQKEVEVTGLKLRKNS